MNTKVYRVLIAAAGTVALALALWVLVSKPYRNDSAESGAVTESHLPGVEGDKPEPNHVDLQSRESQSSDLSLAQRLMEASEGNRLVLLGELSKLPSASQWDILSDPRVRDFLWAREQRKESLSNCSLVLQADEDHWPQLLKSKDLVRDWCAGIVEGRSRDQMHGELLALSNDQQLIASQLDRGTYLDRSVLDDGENQAFDESLLRTLAEKTDSLSVYSAVRDLVWSVQSPLWRGREREYSAMSRFERESLGIALAQLVACQKAGGCGPNNVRTVSYCATYPWLHCSRGESLDDILRSNLSPVQLELLQQLSRRALCLATTPTGEEC